MEALRVLVVDDESGMRLGVQRALRDFTVHLPDINQHVRFDVAQAASGEEALDVIEVQTPDILLLDHKLPGLSGLDVLERITEREDDIQTVMITAYASIDTAITATKRGAYDFLAKPFTPDELKGAVRKAAKHLLLQREARRLAEEKRQVRFQFISVLAHELKAPIAAIEGHLRIIHDRSAGDKQDVYDHMLDRCIIRLDGMRKLILDLLDLTRIESGQKKRELTQVDLVQISRDVLETFEPQAVPKNIAVELHGDPVCPLLADRGELEIILNNLVSNAIKYNRPDGRVDVAIECNDSTVTIRVQDTGIGMSPEETERLFHEFTRIKNAKTRDILGSGLGLSIVKKLAALYGGNVTVTSENDVGTTFTVRLNATQETPPNENNGNT